MKRVLKWFVYEFDDSSMSNRWFNNIDCFLVLLYFLISIFNAYNCAYNIRVFDKSGKIKIEFITTILVILINIVILIRMYIKLHLQYIEEEKNVKLNLNRNERYDKIIIESLEKRLSQVRNVWLICIVVIIFICFYGNVVINSVCAMAVVCAFLTFLNDIIDIAVNKYSAKSKSAVIKYIRQGG